MLWDIVAPACVASATEEGSYVGDGRTENSAKE